MHNDVCIARQKLDDGKYTCVLLSNGEEYTSHERGVKPLLTLLRSGKNFKNSVAADKTVGAGAAHLYVLLGVRALWSNIVSESALKVLRDNKIEVFYGECVPHIINRQGNGICPIERAVANTKDSNEAYDLITKALKALQQNQSVAERREKAVKIFKALGDESRIEIIELLRSGTKCGCELLNALNIGQPTLSHHMHILCDAGLVDACKDGKKTLYSLSKDGLKELKIQVDQYTAE